MSVSNQIVRPLESMADTQPKLQSALLSLLTMISQKGRGRKGSEPSIDTDYDDVHSFAQWLDRCASSREIGVKSKHLTLAIVACS